MKKQPMARLTVRVTPRSRYDKVIGYKDGTVLIRLKALPVKGAANRALVKLIADRLSLPKSAVTVVRGRSSRMKVIDVEGLDASEALVRLGF